jgi:hypothetical protein
MRWALGRRCALRDVLCLVSCALGLLCCVLGLGLLCCVLYVGRGRNCFPMSLKRAVSAADLYLLTGLGLPCGHVARVSGFWHSLSCPSPRHVRSQKQKSPAESIRQGFL